MRLLVTGAFGDLGQAVVRAALERGHRVRAFDLPGWQNRRTARRLRRGARGGGSLETRWGDIRDPAAVGRAVERQDVVFHSAAILAPASERAPERSRAVNVGGTGNVLAALQAELARRGARESRGLPRTDSPRILYPSSVALYGPGDPEGPPRRASDPVHPTDHYTRHKAECEALVRDSGLPHLILRVGVALDPRAVTVDPEILRLMFRIRPENRLETVHPRDVARAVVHALDRPGAWNRTLLIAGGAGCRIRQRDLLGTAFGAVGIGAFEDGSLGREAFYTDWMDTAEAEELLQFQRYSFDDFRRESYARYRLLRRVLWPTAPAARWLMLRAFGPHPRGSQERS